MVSDLNTSLSQLGGPDLINFATAGHAEGQGGIQVIAEGRGGERRRRKRRRRSWRRKRRKERREEKE